MRAAAEEGARQVALLKSARYTVTRPLLLGAALAPELAADGVDRALNTYGDAVGLAFQLRDDVLGVFGDPAVTGKGCLDDLREGKRTLLALRALRLADGASRELLSQASGTPVWTARQADRCREVIAHSGALASVERLIAHQHELAVKRSQTWSNRVARSRAVGCERRRTSALSMADARQQVVVVGAGLGGLSAACHLAGRGPRGRRSSSGRRCRAAGPASLEAAATGSTPGRPCSPCRDSDRALLRRRRGRRWPTSSRSARSTRCTGPCFADGSELRVRHGREAMAEEIRTRLRAERGGRLRPVLRLARAPLRPRDAELHRPQLRLARSTSPARCGPALRAASASAASAGWPRPSARYFDDERLRRLFSFQAMYAGLAPYEALALYAVITYMDTVEGVFVPEGGMHALPGGAGRRARREGRRRRSATARAVERIVLRARHRPGRCTGVRPRRRRASSPPTRSSATPTCRSPTAPCCPGLEPPRAARRGRYSPSARRVARRRARRRCPPGVAHHNIHFGQRLGRRRSAR